MPERKRYQHDGVEGIKVGRFNGGINTNFIVYRIGETVIDAGPSNQWKYVKSFLSESPVKQLWLTHHHEDHSGNAARIAKQFGITPWAPELGRAKLASGYSTPPVQILIWGRPKPVQTQPLPEQLVLDDGTPVFPVHTPGHAKDLTCFYIPAKGWLFSGDLFIARSLKYLRADEDLGQLMSSIQKVVDLEFETLFCPHAGVIENGRQALKQKLENLQQLCDQAAELHRRGLAMPEIVKQLLGPEDVIARLTGNNICKMNLIKQAVDCSHVQ